MILGRTVAPLEDRALPRLPQPTLPEERLSSLSTGLAAGQIWDHGRDRGRAVWRAGLSLQTGRGSLALACLPRRRGLAGCGEATRLSLQPVPGPEASWAQAGVCEGRVGAGRGPEERRRSWE